MDRREFLNRFSAASASAFGACAGAGAAAAETVLDTSREVGNTVLDGLEQRVDALSQQFAQLTGRLSNRLDGVALRLDLLTGQVAYQQAAVKLLFLLVLMSFVIDGGMALHLLALDAPV